MQPQTVKQEAIEAIQRLPEDADIDEIMYRLYVLGKLRRSRAAIEQGQFIHHNDLKREIDAW